MQSAQQRWQAAPAERRFAAQNAAVVRLAGVVLPPSQQRDHVVPQDERGAQFDAGYDFRTLFYDAIWSPGAGRVALIAPKLLNFERLIRSAEFRFDGRAVRPGRILRHRRHDVVLLPAPTAPARLTIACDDWAASVDPPPAEAEVFAGRNVLMTLSRDNSLRWIRDWAAYHVREHGADAVLFYDNGSRAYGVDDLLDTLAGVEGLAAVRVVSVAAPFGAIPARGSRSRALFLQTALWNIGRLRFLRDARAVLPCDVDELVTRRGGRSVFDAAAASWGGFVKFRGAWRTHRLGPDIEPLHRDHVFLPEGGSGCPPKYCVAPTGWLRGRSWNTHGLDRLPFSRLFGTDEFGYLHCHGITTHWKGATSRRTLPAGSRCEATEELLTRRFGERRTG